MKKIFIISSGTGVGKTLVTCAISHNFKAEEKNFVAVKPVISGFEFEDTPNDLSQLMDAQGVEYARNNIGKFSKAIYSLPLSPDMSAEKEGKDMPNVRILKEFVDAQKKFEYCIIEGVGGIMVPLNSSETYLDFIKQTYDESTDKNVLVLGSYLGSLSHSLTTLEVLRNKKIKVDVIVISQSLNEGDELYINVEDTKNSLQNFYGGKIIAVENLEVGEEVEQLKGIFEGEGLFREICG